MMIHHRPFGKQWWVLALSGVLLSVGLVLSHKGWVAIHCMGTTKRMQWIMLALENYHEVNGCYPPQYLADEYGKPAHSWRVLLLPYLGYEELYSRYSFEEPWNGPQNRLLAKEMPGAYHAPFADSSSTITQYVGIAGKETPWRGTTALTRADLRPRSDAVIWFIEAANSDINWMEPRDIPFEQAAAGVNASRGGIQSYYYSWGLPTWTLERFRWVPLDISPDEFKAMLVVPKKDVNVPEQGSEMEGSSDQGNNGRR